MENSHDLYRLPNKLSFTRNRWRFEGYSENSERIYIVESEVFTPDILHEIIEHDVQNELVKLSVDAYLAEYTMCQGCELLNIQLQKECHALLDSPKYKHLIFYESF